MPTKPDPRTDFSLTEQSADNQGTTTEEVDVSEAGSGSVSTRKRDKASTATDDHGSFLLRDRLKNRGDQ